MTAEGAGSDMAAGFELVLTGRVECLTKDGVAMIRMNRPDKRNALDGDQITALAEALRWFAQADAVRAAVITGAGSAFCAGGDIEMFQTLGPDNSLEFTRMGHDLLRALENGRKPVIAAVTGHCLAGGLELALACDFIIASETARLGLTEVNLGLIPGWGGTVRIAKAIPVRIARQLVLTGERLTPQRAQSLGLVNEVLPDDAQTLKRALALATRIAGQAPTAVRAAKAVMNATDSGAGLDATLSLEAAWSANLFSTTPVKEKVCAWVAGKLTT